MNYITKIKNRGINWIKLTYISPLVYEYCCYKVKMSDLYINEVEV